MKDRNDTRNASTGAHRVWQPFQARHSKFCGESDRERKAAASIMGMVDTTATANESVLQTQLKTDKAAMTTRHLSAEMMAKVSSENAVVKFGKSAGRNVTADRRLQPCPST